MAGNKKKPERKLVSVRFSNSEVIDDSQMSLGSERQIIEFSRRSYLEKKSERNVRHRRQPVIVPLSFGGIICFGVKFNG